MNDDGIVQVADMLARQIIDGGLASEASILKQEHWHSDGLSGCILTFQTEGMKHDQDIRALPFQIEPAFVAEAEVMTPSINDSASAHKCRLLVIFD